LCCKTPRWSSPHNGELETNHVLKLEATLFNVQSIKYSFYLLEYFGLQPYSIISSFSASGEAGQDVASYKACDGAAGSSVADPAQFMYDAAAGLS